MATIRASKRRKLSPAETSDIVSSDSELDVPLPSQNNFYASAAQWDLEQCYEQRQRRQKKKEKESTRLPIKTAEGKVEQPPVVQVQREDIQVRSGSEDGIERQATPGAVQEVRKPIRQQILEAKEELARIANLINENPEEHAGGFRSLASIAASSILTIKKLALATQLAVYKDAIPGYRIRPIAEADQIEKVSKDVRRLRAFEQSLVSAYQGYVRELATHAKTAKEENDAGSASLPSIAISCACALLIAVPHFNFRGELLKILVAKLSSRKVDGDFVKCREAIEKLFHNDDDGGSSLDAVSLITRMIKARNYSVHESVLNTFLHLRLLNEFSSKASQNRIDKPTTGEIVNGKKAKFKKEFRTKKQRKLMKERKVIEKEFNEADAIVSHEQRDRLQSETLKLVFVTYFRILKGRVPNLMGAVLEGLARYAHLINQDFFGDLLESLRDLVSDAESILNPDCEESDLEKDKPPISKSERNCTREALLCTTTAFALLEGQDAAKSASALDLDLTFFTSHLYRNLHALSVNPDLELSVKSLHLADPHSDVAASPTTTGTKINLKTTTVLLIRALTSILSPRTVPPIRLAAFTKQLFISSLQLPEKSALAMMSLLTSILKSQGRKLASLWNTEERKGDGVFDAMRGDFESCNAFASTVWEGELLKLHFAPSVKEAAKGIETVVQGIR